VGRRREIGLTDLQMDDVLALRFECACPLQHFEGGLNPDASHPFC
jgi:hypothetical protein